LIQGMHRLLIGLHVHWSLLLWVELLVLVHLLWIWSAHLI
jgi:hypothetical protein